MNADMLIDGDLTIIPYVEVNEQRTVPDSIIIELFNGMVKDKVLKKVFYSKTVESASQLIEFLKDPHNYAVVTMDKDKVCGVAWLNGLYNNHADAHFCFLRRAWGENSYKLGERIIQYWFAFESNGKKLLEVLLGMTPASNKAALRFIEKLGFTKVGVIPKILDDKYKNESVAAMISYRENDYGIS